MTYKHTGAEKVAAITAIAGIVTVVSMPFFSIPFHVPYPSWVLIPMEHGIFLGLFSLLVLIVGVPASLIAIRQKRRRLGWISLISCVVTWPLGVVAIFVVAFLCGESISIY